MEALLNGAGLAAGRTVDVPSSSLAVRIWQAHAPQNVLPREFEALT